MERGIEKGKQQDLWRGEKKEKLGIHNYLSFFYRDLGVGWLVGLLVTLLTVSTPGEGGERQAKNNI
jgi:hypothetical protein